MQNRKEACILSSRSIAANVRQHRAAHAAQPQHMQYEPLGVSQVAGLPCSVSSSIASVSTGTSARPNSPLSSLGARSLFTTASFSYCRPYLDVFNII